MTLPSSGPLSMSQFAAEYGVANSTPLSGYKGKPGIPNSNPVSFSEFYGQSNVSFNPDGGSVSDEQPEIARVMLNCNLSAVWTYADSGSGGIGSASVSVSSGASATSILFQLVGNNRPGGGGGVFPANHSWTVSGTAAGVTRNFTVSLIVDGD